MPKALNPRGNREMALRAEVDEKGGRYKGGAGAASFAVHPASPPAAAEPSHDMKQSDVFLALLLHGGGGGGGVLATAPRPLLIERQSDFDVVFCQGAHYSSGASCEVDGVPSYGTGYCATLSAEPGQCSRSPFPPTCVEPGWSQGLFDRRTFPQGLSPTLAPRPLSCTATSRSRISRSAAR